MRLLALALAGLSIGASSLAAEPPVAIPARSEFVGVNLSGLSYYGTAFPFSNLLKSSGGWGSTDNKPLTSLAPDGTPTALAPGQKAHAPVTWDHTQYPLGRYTVLWDGDGSLSFPLSRVKVVESQPHRIVLEPTDNEQQMWVQIDATNPADPVRNVRFLLPGAETTAATQPFNPTYLKRIAPFSVLRFMDWGATNGSPIVEWADRPLPAQATYSGEKGVPIEVMIDLANTLHADPWFCIPHRASDDYVRRFATLLHERLDPSLKPFIEYSNEMWNGGFGQTRWAMAQSDAQKLPKPHGMPSILYARRAVQVFEIVRSVWGPTDSRRIVRVLAGQAAWTQFLEDALADGDTAAHIDAIAIAPYFSAEAAGDHAKVDASLRLSPDDIVDQLLASVRGPVKAWINANAALAKRYKVRLLGYEAGPSDTTWSFPADKQDPLLSVFKAGYRSPRMKQVYAEYWDAWIAAGGSTMNQFFDVGAWSKWGLWGALEATYQDPATSPRYQGLLDVIAAHPRR